MNAINTNFNTYKIKFRYATDREFICDAQGLMHLLKDRKNPKGSEQVGSIKIYDNTTETFKTAARKRILNSVSHDQEVFDYLSEYYYSKP